MAIIYSYPTVIPTTSDLVLGTDVSANGKPTKNFTIQGIIDLVTVTGNSLQAVLNIGDTAVGKDINLTNNGFLGSGLTTVGGSTIIGTVGAGFTSFTSTIFTTAAGGAKWENTVLSGFTGIGTQTITVSGAFTGAAVVQTMPSVTGGSTTKVVSEKGIIDYLTLKPFTETLFETLQASVTPADPGATPPVAEGVIAPAFLGAKGFDIDMGSTGVTNGNILFGDNKKIRMGDTTYPFELFYGIDPGPATGTVAILQNKTAAISMTLRSDILNLSSIGSVGPDVEPENYLTATKDNGVLLYYNNVKTFETVDGGAKVTGILTVDNLDNNGYYKDSTTSAGTDGQLLSSSNTGTKTKWIDNPNPDVYLWKIQADSGSDTPTGLPFSVTNGKTIDFEGVGNIATQWDDTNNKLKISLTDTPERGSGAESQVTYWGPTTAGQSTLKGESGFTFIEGNNYLRLFADGGAAGSGIVGAAYLTTYTGATVPIPAASPQWTGGVMSSMVSVTTVPNAAIPDPSSDPVVTNLNGFFGPLRASAASTNVTAGVADKAVELTGVGTITLNAGSSQVVSSETNIYKAGAAINLKVVLNNDAVIGKVLTGLVVPASGSSVVPTDTILSGIGKLQAQVNTGATGLRFIGSWNASMDTGGTDNTPNGTPALTSGGGLATSGTNTSVNTPVDNKLIDGTASFLSTVTANDRVYNEAGAFTTITSIDSNTELTLADAIFLTTGQAYTIDNDPALSQGEYYVVSAIGASEARNATLNSIQNWQVGDWVISGANNVWERLDQTSVDGTGTPDRIPKWNTASSLNDSIIIQNSTGIKLDTGKDFATQGSGAITSASTFNANGDIIMSAGTGVSLPVGAYGAAGQVLTAPASPSTGAPLVWSTPTTGVVESITGGFGITVDDSSDPGTAAVPVVSVDYVGTTNAILSATAATEPILTTDQIWFNDIATLDPATINKIKKAPISSLPFDSYSSWDLAGDSGSDQAISSGNTATFAGGTGVVTSTSATDTLTTALRYEDSDNSGTIKNFIESAATLAPAAADFLIFGDQAGGSAKNAVKKATIADIVDLGNETLAQVLANGNTTGGTDIAVTAGDDITFPDNSIAKFGTGNDLFIFHDSNNSAIAAAGTGNLNISTNSGSVQINKSNSETMAEFTTDGSVDLYHNGTKKFETTTAGATVTGSVTTNSSGIAGVFNSGATNVVASFTSTDAIGVIQLVDNSGNVEIGAGGNGNFVVQPNGGTTQLRVGTNSSEFGGNLQIDGNLSVTGIISHTSGGGGSGTAKGGTFTKLYTTGNAGVAGIAFTINRITTGVMIFDVMLTSDTSTACAVAKKFTVVKSYGASPLFNKILDTGPDFDTSDFTVVFAQHTTDTSIKCTITPVYTNTQKIGVTIDLGFGQNDASVVMN